MTDLSEEEKYMVEVIKAARLIQVFLWGEANDKWGIEEWKRMFRKRNAKIDDIDDSNPHAAVEFRKRLMQNAALSIALVNILDKRGIPTGEDCDIPSNLPQYAALQS